MSDAKLPENPSGLTPYLTVSDSAAAIEWYAKAFGGEELFRIDMPGGGVGHAEVVFRHSPGKFAVIHMADESVSPGPSPLTAGGTTAFLHLNVAAVDPLWDRAVAAGAEVVFPLEDQFYGHRAGRLRDPFGHEWLLSQTIEEVSVEEMMRRMEAMGSEGGGE